jgi:hypothetical protein
MTAPLPPVVVGPIYAVPNVQVYVDNVLPDALVKVLQDGHEVGHATSTEPGDLWVTTTVALDVGKTITATQTYQGTATYIDATPGVQSAPSNVGIPVLAVPTALPVPVFLSGVSQCSDSVWLGSLIPGCTLTVWQSGNALISALIVHPRQWFTLATAPLAVGVSLQARQELVRDISPIGSSLAVFAEPSSLSKPAMATPIRDCQTFLDISNVTPGADIEITNAGRQWFATSPWPSYTVIDLPPLEAGTVTAQQYFTRCQNVPKSAITTRNVGRTPVPLPKVGYALCESVHQFTVSNLIAGEILTLKRVVTPASGPATVTDIGSQGISSSVATVNLPPSFAPTDSQGTVSVRLSVSLCGLETSAPPYVTIPISTATGPFPLPSLKAPLFDCATFVIVVNANPGSLIRITDGTTGQLLTNPLVAATADLIVPLWNPLVTGETVVVQQQGCHADGTSKPVTVLAVPNPLPIPVIARPVLAGVATVDVAGLIPGARVYLYVNGAYRSQVEAIAGVAALPAGTPALAAGDYVEVTQAICTETSARTDRGPGYAPVLAPVPAPPQGLISNFNYFLGNGGPALTGVAVKVTFDAPFVSTVNGYSFQFNCYSTEGPTITTEWQQFVIYASPNSTQLVARIDTWNGTALSDELNRIDTNLANLPSATIDAGTTFDIVLTYDSSNGAGTVTGAIYTVKDGFGNELGTAQITIVGNTLRTTNQAATALNLAPIAAFQFNIGGDYGGNTGTFASGGGTITYASNEPLTVTTLEPTYTDYNGGTAEDGNVVFGQLPISNSAVVTQTFQVVPAPGATGQIRRRAPYRHVLPPPDDRSFGVS